MGLRAPLRPAEAGDEPISARSGPRPGFEWCGFRSEMVPADSHDSVLCAQAVAATERFAALYALEGPDAARGAPSPAETGPPSRAGGRTGSPVR